LGKPETGKEAEKQPSSIPGFPTSKILVFAVLCALRVSVVRMNSKNENVLQG
jgi:hypothetical protein